MAGREIRVNLVVDTTAFVAACERAARATRKFHSDLVDVRPYIAEINRFTRRLVMSPGDRHIDRVCREIATGVPGRDPVIRLIAASDFAAVLDRSYTA